MAAAKASFKRPLTAATAHHEAVDLCHIVERRGVPCTSKVEIALRCRGLRNADVLSKSDPMVVLYMKEADTWEEVGRTECILDTLNPEFATSFIVPFFFADFQLFRFDVFDIDGKSDRLSDHDFLGQAQATLGDLVASPGQTLYLALKELNGKPAKGEIIVSCEEVTESRTTIQFALSGEHLDKKDFFGKSDPYIEIHRKREDGGTTLVHRTEVVMKTLDPTWEPFEISAQKLNNGDFERPLLFQCFDWDRVGKPDLIGVFERSLRQIMTDFAQGKAAYTLVNSQLSARRQAAGSGVIRFNKCRTWEEATFLDYIAGGCNINLVIAIDFTASNGDPRTPGSLHSLDKTRPNQYVQAMQSVAEILVAYDTDRHIPLYGFGAKLGAHQPVSHCFPLTMDNDSPEVHGIEGVLSAYSSVMQYITLKGPTLFGSILDTVTTRWVTTDMRRAAHYTIMLIITDGVIDDMEQTVDKIVAASQLPLSIVIVGVGQADFTNMHILDGDSKRLRSTTSGKEAVRDIVQFVPMRDFELEANPVVRRARLAQATLAEIPGQLVEYMRTHGIRPEPPRSRLETRFVAGESAAAVGGGMGAAPAFAAQTSVLYPTGARGSTA